MVERQAGVDGVGRVGELDVEAVLGPEVLLVEVGGDDVGNLQECGPVLAHRLLASRVHPIEKLHQNTGRECCHDVKKVENTSTVRLKQTKTSSKSIDVAGDALHSYSGCIQDVWSNTRRGNYGS